MRRFLLDTGILSDLINRRRGIRERSRAEIVAGHRIGTAPVVVAELAFGVEYGENRDRNMQSLRSVLPTLTLWPFDLDAAYRYGQIAAELRRTGRPMQVVDIMISAVAMTIGNCTVVSRDSDLVDVPGLSVENWAVN